MHDLNATDRIAIMIGRMIMQAEANADIIRQQAAALRDMEAGKTADKGNASPAPKSGKAQRAKG